MQFAYFAFAIFEKVQKSAKFGVKTHYFLTQETAKIAQLLSGTLLLNTCV